MPALRTWLQLSDELLSAAWGSMDRYHLVWLSVGRSNEVRGRRMSLEEESAYVRDVAAQKTAALQMSLKAAQDHMPFLGETPESGEIRRISSSGTTKTVAPPWVTSAGIQFPSPKMPIGPAGTLSVCDLEFPRSFIAVST